MGNIKENNVCEFLHFGENCYAEPSTNREIYIELIRLIQPIPERLGGEVGDPAVSLGDPAVSLAISSSLEVIDPMPDELELDIITAPDEVLGLAVGTGSDARDSNLRDSGSPEKDVDESSGDGELEPFLLVFETEFSLADSETVLIGFSRPGPADWERLRKGMISMLELVFDPFVCLEAEIENEIIDNV